MTPAELALVDPAELKRQRERARYRSNRDAVVARTKAYQKAHPERVREYARKSREKNRLMLELSRLRKKYGINHWELVEMLRKCERRCEICRSDLLIKNVMVVDHCHKTGRVRGLLCRKCNSGIGLLRDDLALVKSAVEYLSR